eukprot:CAMPEP_0167799044 /NCGR_PEP_ID=MMETSP0111_2-20121227/16735_1 /TAXON_ID=91324 /ORGANISM="Lotharella globosa, Strain CCCM811" /LENGTH=89 /DNA_ID=CAMNT_0007693705 /DNA_START=284 /DNA_END=553 /DNA_ORIENTATION=+
MTGRLSIVLTTPFATVTARTAPPAMSAALGLSSMLSILDFKSSTIFSTSVSASAFTTVLDEDLGVMTTTPLLQIAPPTSGAITQRVFPL